MVKANLVKTESGQNNCEFMKNSTSPTRDTYFEGPGSPKHTPRPPKEFGRKSTNLERVYRPEVLITAIE